MTSSSRAPESAVRAVLTRPSSPAAATFFADPLLDAVTRPLPPAITIPPPSPTPLPAPPAELEPLLRVVAPLANTGCSPIGFEGVVVALV